MRQTEATEKPERDKGNEALRELAGRLKRLSYRDMSDLAIMLGSHIDAEHQDFASALLTVADDLETA